MKIHPIGTKLYIAHAWWVPIERECPVCEGKQKVHVKPIGAADDKGYFCQCEYCEYAERDGRKAGTVADRWDWIPKVEEIEVNGSEISQTIDATKVKYTYNKTSHSWNTVDGEKCFENMEDAEKAAGEIAEQYRPQKSELPSHTHSVGYALDQIKSNQRKIKQLQKQVEQWKNFKKIQKAGSDEFI